jgi:hypothetical protein
MLLKPEVKKKWLDGLSSGEYPQAQYALRTPAGYCCIGVLYDVNKELLNGEWKEPELASQTHFNFHSGESFRSGFIAMEDIKKLIINPRDTYIVHDILKDLAAKNDDGASFATISKEIKERL